MSGPFVGARAAQPMDLLLQQGMASDGWQGLEALLNPETPAAEFAPPERVAMFLYGLYSTPDGRDVFEWLMDITLRQPLRATGRTFEETALMTATRQGINGVGEAILKAIARGEELAGKHKSQPQNGAG